MEPTLHLWKKSQWLRNMILLNAVASVGSTWGLLSYFILNMVLALMSELDWSEVYQNIGMYFLLYFWEEFVQNC